MVALACYDASAIVSDTLFHGVQIVRRTSSAGVIVSGTTLGGGCRVVWGLCCVGLVVYVWVCGCRFVCVCGCGCGCVGVGMNVCVGVGMHVCVGVGMCVCVYIYMCEWMGRCGCCVEGYVLISNGDVPLFLEGKGEPTCT